MNAPLTDKRIKSRQLLCSVLGSEEMAKNLEVCAYNWTIDQATQGFFPHWDDPLFSSTYTEKIRSLLFNLRNKNNPSLLENVLSGTIKLHKLVKMTPIEMFPENWEEAINKVIEKRMISERSYAKEQVEGIFECRRCKSKKTVYVQYQIRSADEPMTTFVTCLNCDKRWKFN